MSQANAQSGAGPDQSAVRLSLEDRRVVTALLGLIVLIGLALRISRFGQGLVGDELSTLWIVRDDSLSGVISTVHSDAEITPPLYFVLAWFASKLGSAPELIRLPSLIAGTLLIPAVFLLARRLSGNAGGLAAAAMIALSPFAINSSGDARNYAVLMLLITVAALALVFAGDGRGKGWWGLYAACACLALYSHYTAVFVIVAMFCWALWARRDRWKPLLVSTAMVGVFFLPWLGGYFADSNSPTTAIAEALLDFGPGKVVEGVGLWGAGLPHDWVLGLGDVPGPLAGGLILAGLLLAAAGCLWRPRWNGPGPVKETVVLVLLLAFAAPVGEIIYSLLGSAVFGPRNLSPSLPGLAVAIGMLVTSAGVLAWGSVILVLAGYSLSTLRAFDTDRHLPDYESIARTIERESQPGDVIVDTATPLGSPTPLTPLDVYLRSGHAEYRLGLPPGEPPFLVAPPASDGTWAAAVESARGHRMFVVDPDVSGLKEPVREGLWVKEGFVDAKLEALAAKPGFRVRKIERRPGLIPLDLYVVTVPTATGQGVGTGG